MKKLFSLIALLSLAVGFTACEEVQPVDNHDYEVVLSATKSAILADGQESVNFEVTVDGVVTEEAMIICLNDNTVLRDAKFSTTKAGEYRFVASYKDATSPAVTITATPTEQSVSSVVLTADKGEIMANGTDIVTFTVTVDGEDMTSDAVITVVNYATELEDNTFSTDVAGEFVFEAKYGDTKSNQVIVNAVAVDAPTQKSLTLTASTMRIKADGAESVTFTAMYGEEDVTATCELRTTAGEVLESNIFSTTVAGTYNVYALYNDTRSNTISIDAYDPNVTYAYEIGKIYEVNGSKCVAYAIKDNFAYFFSMDEADLQWSTENVYCNCNSSKGEWNTYDPFDPRYSKAEGGVRDINNYPAFKWCMEHGEGWFMPSSTELQWMWDAISNGTHRFENDSVAAYNKLLTDNGGMPFVETYYWSSNETSDDMIELIAFMSDSVVCLEPMKTYIYTVRAVTRVQL